LLGSLDAHAQNVLEKSKSGTTVSVPKGDADIAEVVQKAKSRLVEFLKLAKFPAPGTSGFAAEIAFLTRVERNLFG
jgi:hypothetical protein